jgi:hypothetical protein
MDIMLHPTIRGRRSLDELYDEAIAEAVELSVVSAYLTHWESKRGKPRDDCRLSFIVGTGFGITRKSACQAVLRWLPPNMKNDFLAADRISGFHPKVIVWKTARRALKLVIGSSNLTQAAFLTNYEANVFSEISQAQYNTIKEWVDSIRIQCSPISEDWLRRYKEAENPPATPGAGQPPMVSLTLPHGRDIESAIATRRKQQATFSEIRQRLKDLIRQCARAEITNEVFYKSMMALWGRHPCRFQGSGIQWGGRAWNWHDVCGSLDRILSEAERVTGLELDIRVRAEVDMLEGTRNSARKAWLSEMLCHFFPAQYPVLTKPIWKWLQEQRYRRASGATEGAKYIALAVSLRHAIQDAQNEARDLAELDHAIWWWWHNHS